MSLESRSKLEAENARLSEQVKRVVKTEARLYHTQERLDVQQRAYKALVALCLDFASAQTEHEILRLSADFVLYGAELECAVLFEAQQQELSVVATEGYFEDEQKAELCRLIPESVSALLRSVDQHPMVLAADGPLPEGAIELKEHTGLEELVAVVLPKFGVLVAGNSKGRARHFARIAGNDEIVVILSLLASQFAATMANHRAREQLAERTKIVERANAMKSAFLANMSHELRTPLNAIIGFTRIVRRKTVGLVPERQTQNLDKVERSAINLLAIINDVLDLSKVEAGRTEIKIKPVQLERVVRQVVEEIRPLSDAKGLALCLECCELPPVMTDDKRLRQVVMNLLSNAVKFTRRGGISVAVRPNGKWVRITVVDTGIGIPPEHIDSIFEPFRQVDDSRTREVGGTGLGLPIARQLTMLMGGRLEISSMVDRGTTFTIHLPSEHHEVGAGAQ